MFPSRGQAGGGGRNAWAPHAAVIDTGPCTFLLQPRGDPRTCLVFLGCRAVGGTYRSSFVPAKTRLDMPQPFWHIPRPHTLQTHASAHRLKHPGRGTANPRGNREEKSCAG